MQEKAAATLAYLLAGDNEAAMESHRLGAGDDATLPDLYDTHPLLGQLDD